MLDPRKLANYREALLGQGLEESFVDQLEGHLETIAASVESIDAFPIEDGVFPYMIPNLYKNEAMDAPGAADEYRERALKNVEEQIKLVKRLQREMDAGIEPFPFFRAR